MKEETRDSESTRLTADRIKERGKTFSVKGLQFLIGSCVIQMLLLNEGLVHHSVISSCVCGDNNNVMSETDDQKKKSIKAKKIKRISLLNGEVICVKISVDLVVLFAIWRKSKTQKDIFSEPLLTVHHIVVSTFSLLVFAFSEKTRVWATILFSFMNSCQTRKVII